MRETTDKTRPHHALLAAAETLRDTLIEVGPKLAHEPTISRFIDTFAQLPLRDLERR